MQELTRREARSRAARTRVVRRSLPRGRPAEQRDGHRDWQLAAWFCFVAPVLLAGRLAWRRW